jgi:cysteine desulfurase family protein
MAHESTDRRRIYLDNAATSWPKPAAVYDAVDDYQRRLGAPAGRSGYSEAAEVSQRIEAARRRIATLVGLQDASHLIFTSNGTDSLNLVLHGLLRAGDHVVTTVVEHNSVLRPLAELAERAGVEATYVGCASDGIVDPDEIRAAIRKNTRLVAITHASNVTGALQPVEAIAAMAREAGVLVLCDAAQTLGHQQVDLARLGVDFLAAPGHKGLLGPLGTGILAMRPEAAAQLRSVRQGGTGTQSERARQPDELPSKFEAGNLNVPGILGLAAGAEYLTTRGLDDVERHGRELCQRLLGGLESMPSVRVFGPAGAHQRVPLVSLVIDGYDPQEIAAILDAAHHIQTRPGLHCAPLMHAALGTQTGGGTVRFSLGPLTTKAEIEVALEAVGEIAGIDSTG